MFTPNYVMNSSSGTEKRELVIWLQCEDKITSDLRAELIHPSTLCRAVPTYLHLPCPPEQDAPPPPGKGLVEGIRGPDTKEVPVESFSRWLFLN